MITKKITTLMAFTAIINFSYPLYACQSKKNVWANSAIGVGTLCTTWGAIAIDLVYKAKQNNQQTNIQTCKKPSYLWPTLITASGLGLTGLGIWMRCNR